MPSFIVELYVPRASSLARARATARPVSEAARRSGLELRHVRTLFVAEDETCFHVFEAPSRETLAAAVRDAGLTGARIAEAVQSEARSGGTSPTARPAPNALDGEARRCRALIARPNGGPAGRSRRFAPAVARHCTFAVTVADPARVNVQVFCLLPPLEQAP